MLFNRAFSTIVDEEPDLELINRILAHRFPVRRKGVAWVFEGDRLRLYRPSDPSRSILDNTLDFEFTENATHRSGFEKLRIMDFVLSRCNGLVTHDEIANEVQSIFNLPREEAQDTTADILNTLSAAWFVTDF